MKTSSNMPVETKLKLSKRFPPGTSEIKFGLYKLKAIPVFSAAEAEAVLSFINTYKDPIGGGSHPEEEANIICKILSLFFNTQIKKNGFRINNIDIPVLDNKKIKTYSQFFGNLEFQGLSEFILQILSLGEDLARQFIRACNCYSFALEFIPSDPTFAFFLLVVAVECLSSQNQVIPFLKSDPEKKKCERFCDFIISFIPESKKNEDEKNTELFRELLKTTYYTHRSGFVHGGKEVSSGALMADRVGSSYFKHSLDGKETKTPGLAWFTKVTREAILGFLFSKPSYKNVEVDNELFSKLAFEKAVLKVKAKRKIDKYQLVTFDDIKFR